MISKHLASAHKKLKYLKRKMKKHGKMKRELEIARAALKRIEKESPEWQFGEDDTHSLIMCRMYAEDALRDMKEFQ